MGREETGRKDSRARQTNSPPANSSQHTQIMAYAQYIEIRISAENCALCIRNATLSWGKFYKQTNKDDELTNEQINAITIDTGTFKYICSCGRASAASGTEGSFDIYDAAGPKDANGNPTDKVTHVKWVCPWGPSYDNSRSHEQDNHGYGVTMTGGESKEGSIGEVTLSIVKLS